MRFGNVLLTRSRMALLIILCSFLGGPTPSLASSQPSDLDLLLGDSYAKLEKRLVVCGTLKNRVVPLTDEGIIALPELTRNVLMLELYKAALNRCSLEEEKAYVYATFKSAVAGNEAPLNEYISLSKFDVPDKDSEKVLASIGNEELKRIKALPEYQFPFNVLESRNLAKSEN